MHRIVGRYVSFDHCRALLPWFEFAAGRSPLARARKLALHFENETTGRGQPNRLIAFFLYVPTSLRQVMIAFSRYAQLVRRDFGIGYHTQLTDLFYLVWRLNHAPHDYYLQKMWLRPRRRDWAQFLTQREHVLLVRQLQPALPLDEFDDKLKLYDRLKAAGIPTIEVRLAAIDGRWLERFPAFRDRAGLRHDLVIKPTNQTMNEGVEIWRYDAGRDLYFGPPFAKIDGIEKSLAHECFDWAGLLERGLRLSKKRPYIIQRRMQNHPVLAAISPHVIGNFRIATVSRQGKIQVASTLLRMGYDPARFLAGNYQANVDEATGVLARATGCLPQWGYGNTHLETGAPVTGRAVPDWPELRSIAVRAHELYPWMPAIGWDIISSDEGPMVMEANAFWGVNLSQLDCPFLGEMGYAEAFWEAYQRR